MLGSTAAQSVQELFYGISPPQPCYYNSFNGENFTVSETRNGQAVQIGSAKLERVRLCNKLSTSGCEASMTIWLPIEQQVFSREQWGFKNGPYKPRESVFKGIYQTSDGKIKRPITITIINPLSGFRVGGTVQDRSYLNIDSGY